MAGSQKSSSLFIRNARIVDGTGGPERRGAIAVRDGLIAAVGESASLEDAGPGAR